MGRVLTLSRLMFAHVAFMQMLMPIQVNGKGMYAPSTGVYLGVTPSDLLNSPLDSKFAVLLQFYDLAELINHNSQRKALARLLWKCAKWNVLPVISLTTFDGFDSYAEQDIVWFANQLNSLQNLSIILRWNHEMNGNWFRWGQRPSEYVQKFQQWYNITKLVAPNVAMMWSPDTGSGYPYGQGTYSPSNTSLFYKEMDTNGDGVVDGLDDPYGPYFPGQDYVEWVGFTGYYWGSAYIKGGWERGLNIVPEPNTFSAGIIESIVKWVNENAPGFPIMIAETAALYAQNITRTEVAGLIPASEYDVKTAFIDQLYNVTGIVETYPSLQGIVWFQHNKLEEEGWGEVFWSLDHDESVLKYFMTTVYSNPFFVTSFKQPKFHHVFYGSDVFFGILVTCIVTLVVIVLSPCISPVIKTMSCFATQTRDEESANSNPREPARSELELKEAFFNFLRGSDWVSYGILPRILHILFLVVAYVVLVYSLFLRATVPGALPSWVSIVVTLVEIGLAMLMLLYNILLIPNPSYYRLLKYDAFTGVAMAEYNDEKAPEPEIHSLIVPDDEIRQLSIDILIVCYKEEESTLAHTLQKCAELIKPKRVTQVDVYLLDDLGVESRRGLCERLGATYLSRASKDQRPTHGKAGNLNFGLSKTHGEFVLILDADMAPEKLCLLFLYRALARGGPMTAFTQAPHRFTDLPAGDVFYSRSLLFNTKTLQFFGSFGYCPFVGSNTLFRRSALKAVGGIDITSITEDIVTSFKMHQLGMKSFFVPIPLCHGTSPQTGPQMYTQRHRWALGGLEFAYDYRRAMLKMNYCYRLLYTYIMFNTLLGPLVFTLLFAALVAALSFNLRIYSDFVGKFTLVYVLAFRISWMSGLVARDRTLTLELWSEEIVGPYYLIPVTIIMWFVNGSFFGSKLRPKQTTRVFKSTVAQKKVQVEHAVYIKTVGVCAAALLFSGLTGLARYYYRKQYGELFISVICVTTGLRTFMAFYWYTVPHAVIQYLTVDASFDCLKTWRFKVMCILPLIDLGGAIAICAYIWSKG